MRFTSKLTTVLAAMCVVITASSVLAADPIEPEISVLTDPPQAQVIIDGASRGISPITVKSSPGSHLVTAIKAGYVDARKTVTVSAQNRSTAVELKLERECGLVLIKSEPSSADVTINQVQRGKTPLLVTDLAPGEYRVKFSKRGCLPVEKALTIVDRTPQELLGELKSDSASISFVSDPPGASVSVNGAPYGQAPCKAEGLPPGNAELVLTLAGYKPYTRSLVLNTGDELDISAVLAPAPATLTIHSVPENAVIYINNERRGNTPLTLTDLEPGDYRVRAEIPGFEALARSVTLKQADNLVEEFRLDLTTGAIEVRTKPAGVLLWIDGQSKGETVVSEFDPDTSSAMRIDLLQPGKHTVEAWKKGYEKKTVSIQIDKGASIAQSIKLRQYVTIRVGTGKDDSVTGYIEQSFDNGDVKLETRPGVLRLFKKIDIKSMEPILTPPPNP